MDSIDISPLVPALLGAGDTELNQQRSQESRSSGRGVKHFKDLRVVRHREVEGHRKPHEAGPLFPIPDPGNLMDMSKTGCWHRSLQTWPVQMKEVNLVLYWKC